MEDKAKKQNPFPVHVQWKEGNQYKNGSPFWGLERHGEMCTLYFSSQFHRRGKFPVAVKHSSIMARGKLLVKSFLSM